MVRDSFVFYRSFYDAFNDDIPDDVFNDVMRALCEYGLNGTEPDLHGVALMAWKLIKPQIDANNKRYEDGKKGGRPKKKTSGYENKNQWFEKTKPNVNVNVNDNVNDNVNVNDNEASQDDTVSLYGRLDNVILTEAQRNELKRYENSNKLIDKVSVWLSNADKEFENHYALCLKFATNDNWPVKPVTVKEEPEPVNAVPMTDEQRKEMMKKLGKALT